MEKKKFLQNRQKGELSNAYKISRRMLNRFDRLSHLNSIFSKMDVVFSEFTLPYHINVYFRITRDTEALNEFIVYQASIYKI